MKFLILCVFSLLLMGCNSENPYNYPSSQITFKELDALVGCGSKLSEQKKEDVFKARFYNHWCCGKEK